MRKLGFLATVFAIFAFASLASAQQGDIMIGFGTVLAPGSSGCTINSVSGFLSCPEKGGLYPNISADVIFHKRLGVAFDAVWRGGQGQYGGTGGQPYRPILYDFNADFQPRLTKKVGLDLLGGIGWQSTRAYGFSNSTSCIYFYACYQSSNHFFVDLGAGVRYYFFGHAFVRPEAHYYYILNNTDSNGGAGLGFTGNNILRVGASIGYTIGPD